MLAEIALKCFYHRDVDAVGSCKNCSRGLCPACASEVLDGLACQGRCEDTVASLSALINRNRRLAPRAAGQYLWLGVFCVLLGIGCGYAGLFTFRSGPLNLMTFLGVVLVGLGGYFVWFARAVSRS